MTMHPSLPLLVAAALQGLVRPGLRGPLAFASALAALAAVVALPADVSRTVPLLGFDLQVMRNDALARAFALVFAVMACLGTLYAWHVRRASEHAATLVYAASSLGVVFAGDWVTLFLFWEIMAVSSATVVWHGPRARAAGLRYILVHLASGALVFAGILILRGDGVSAVAPVPPGTASWFLLAGVAINAAIPPLHAWLTDAYPQASPTGSVFLSAFTTKTAVYVLVRTFPGAELLVWTGVGMALYGVVFAVLENDIRRLLSYHIVSQVGYMVAGVGMGTALALDGTTAHAFSHILYKSLLFMGAGAVIVSTGRCKLTELGGIAPRLKTVVALYMVGAFSISGLPLFNGFVSKSMVVAAASEGGWPIVELLLTLAGVGTFLHTGLKLPYYTFWGPQRAASRVDPIPRNMIVAMAAGATLCVAIGVAPGWLYAQLPHGATYHPYTIDHVVSALQLLLGTGVAFAVLLPRLGGEATISVDTDWLYRRPLRRAIAASVAVAVAAGRGLERAGRSVVVGLADVAADPPGVARRMLHARAGRVPQDVGKTYACDFNRQPVGVTVLWIVAALGLVTVLAR